MTDLLQGFLSGSAAWGVLLTLAAFALGLVVGVLGMLPGWRSRRNVRGHAEPARSDLAPLDDQLTSPPHGV